MSRKASFLNVRGPSWSLLLKLLVLLTALVLWNSAARAACSGSGIAWTCGAGTTPAQVNSAIGSASSGAVITFAGGAYSWGGTTIVPSAAKAVTLQCATVRGCTVSYSSLVFALPPSGSSTNLFRISGFVFNGGGTLMWTCPGGGCKNTWTNLRFDNNTINEASDTQTIVIGESTANQYIYGVIDHNIVKSSGSIIFVYWLNNSTSSPPAPPLGTENNLFIEDNIITLTSVTNSGTGCTDHWGASAIVFRFNTVTNCRVLSHGSEHGGGPSNFEIYSNSITMNAGAVSAGLGDGFRSIHHQGSNTMMVFNNTLTSYSGKSSGAIALLHYRSSPYGNDSPCNGNDSRDGNLSPVSTFHGYPCWRQPGRDVTRAAKPIYVWGNKWSDTGTKVSLEYQYTGGSPDYSSAHVIADREYYNAVSASTQTSPTSPFNGTTGMGFGTLAMRPLTCTHNDTPDGDHGTGVGYFATDQGPQGTLYRCSATNTWTAHYAPYTYPHPLVSGTSGTDAPLTPPTNVSVK